MEQFVNITKPGPYGETDRPTEIQTDTDTVASKHLIYTHHSDIPMRCRLGLLQLSWESPEVLLHPHSGE